MIDALTENLTNTVQNNPWLAPAAALAGGVLTAANPCVIAMVPLMVGYVTGQSEENRSIARSFLLSLTFSIGLTVTFSILFVATWAASSLLRASWWVYVAAAVCLLMGLHVLGVLDFEIPSPKGIHPTQRGHIGALLLGMLFGLVSLPCAGPILLVLLSIIPLKGAVYGGMLLVTYSLGHCSLVLVAGTSVGLVQRMIASKGLQLANLWMKRSAGVLIISVGVFLLMTS